MTDKPGERPDDEETSGSAPDSDVAAESAPSAPSPGWGQAPPPPPGYYVPPGSGQPPPAPGAAGKTNGLAVASMVSGILGLVLFILWPVAWIGSVLAVVFGHISRRQIRDRGEGGDGISLAGVILGWVGVGIWGLAVGIVVLVFVLGSYVKGAFESNCDPFGQSGTYSTTC